MKSIKEMMDLNGKVAIITGATGNLGMVHAESLAELGCKIVLTDIQEDELVEMVDNLSQRYDPKIVGIKMDLLDENSIKETFEKVFENLGRIDILINNAQYTCDEDLEPLETFSKEVWEKIMAVNVTGNFLCCQQAIKYMRENSSIINMSSIYGVIMPNQDIYEGMEINGRKMNSPLIYTTTKAAIIGMTKYLATTLANKKIRVNCISPGGFESGQSEIFKERYNKKVPLGRMANKEELKGAVAYLASGSSSYVTGHNLIFDGGMSLW
jgi:NAD(P)-dependent dehydrogenase (short-subunit alcohol dehydrogenase family)